MGLTQTGKDIKAEADEARRSVPSQFLVKSQNPLSDTFETKVDLLSDDVSRRNAALRKQYDDDHDEREASRAGVLEGRVRDDMFGNRERRLRDQAEQKRRERTDTALYLAMLQQRIDELNHEIEWHNSEIDRLTDEIDDLQELGNLIASGEYDPNNPAHAALRDRTGISQSDIDKGNAPGLIKSGIDDRQTQINAHRVTRANKIDDLNSLKAKQKELEAIKDDPVALQQKVEQMSDAERTALIAEAVTDRELVNAIDRADGYTEPEVGELSSLDTEGQSNSDTSFTKPAAALDTDDLFGKIEPQRSISVAARFDPSMDQTSGEGSKGLSITYNKAADPELENDSPSLEIKATSLKFDIGLNGTTPG